MKEKAWIEKWRPSTYEDVVGAPKELIKIIKEGTGHILLTSVPGMGKTCISKIMVREHKNNSLVLNASDERGIGVVREKIKNFALNMSIGGGMKLINLEEFDYMTPEAQNSLRNLMEEVPNCRFILTANYENKIVEAIKNRCHHFKFVNPDKNEIELRLIKIIEEEKLDINLEALKPLIENNYPSIRNMVKKLQELSMLGKKIEIADVTKDAESFGDLVELIKKKSYKNCQQWAIDSLMDYEYLISKLFDVLMKSDIKGKAQIPGITRRALVDLTMVARKDIVFGDFILELFEVI